MTTPPLLIFPDTTVLMNFAYCDAMDLLARFVADRGRWCASVLAECDHKADEESLPAMRTAHDIFGDPLRPETPTEHLSVTLNREHFLRPGDGPRRHLGESETLAIIAERGLNARFITDDTFVPIRAASQGVKCVTTWDVLRATVLGKLASRDEIRNYRRVLLGLRRVHLAHIRDEAQFETWLQGPAEPTSNCPSP